jgi:hypothetical protein
VGKLRLVLPLLLALGFAACGGGESDEDKVTGTIETAFVKTNPADCQELMTQGYLEQTFRTQGPSALEACEQNARAEESDNPPVEVTKVSVEGSKASADVGSEGGLSGQTFTVALVEEDGDWKLDEIVRIAKLDRGAFLREERKGLESGEDRPDPEVAACIVKAFRQMSKPELEKILFGGSAQAEVEIYERCGRQ